MQPRVHVIATGGTIGGECAPGDRHYTAGRRPAASILAGLPAALATPVADTLEISSEDLLAVDSKDMGPAEWLRILAASRRALADPLIAGGVILHGTDTMEETAYLLHLAVSAGKPLILTGAMRPADHPEADGPANLAAALRRAAGGRGGVEVLMAGAAHAARQVFKAHSTALDAFASRPGDASKGAGRFAQHEFTRLPRVDILPGYAGAPPDLIAASVAAGARGLVLALAGHGSVPDAWRPALAHAQREGVAIIRASRCAGTVAARADDAGLFTAADLPPLKARIALMLALAAGHDDPGTLLSAV